MLWGLAFAGKGLFLGMNPGLAEYVIVFVPFALLVIACKSSPRQRRSVISLIVTTLGLLIGYAVLAQVLCLLCGIVLALTIPAWMPIAQQISGTPTGWLVRFFVISFSLPSLLAATPLVLIAMRGSSLFVEPGE
jgi:hypothetical protein